MKTKFVILQLILIVAIISNSGCASQKVRAVSLVVPPALDLPRIQPLEFECLSDDAYVRLARRDLLLRERVHTLEQIIKSTH